HSTLFLLHLFFPALPISCFVVNATPTSPTYTLSLHDALPICLPRGGSALVGGPAQRRPVVHARADPARGPAAPRGRAGGRGRRRSEEHTSELQSRFDLVCRLLLEK